MILILVWTGNPSAGSSATMDGIWQLWLEYQGHRITACLEIRQQEQEFAGLVKKASASRLFGFFDGSFEGLEITVDLNRFGAIEPATGTLDAAFSSARGQWKSSDQNDHQWELRRVSACY